MLSRASSKGGLRRSKSSASVKTRRPPIAEPFDPRLARAHALTAASLAMQRHSQRSSGDTGGSFDDGYDIDAVPPFRPSRRTRSSRISEMDVFACFDNTSCGAVTPGRQYSVREGSLEPVPELPTDTREFGLGDRLPSQPSSYRRIRKAKSMFSARHRSGQGSNHEALGGVFGRTTLRRSLSFFRGKSATTNNRHEFLDPQDIAVQLAREQYMHDLEHGSPDVSPSVPIRHRQPRPFRKSFRSTSTDDPAVEGDYWKGKLRRSKSRRFSLSIKKGLRRIFGRSSTSNDDAPPLPATPQRFRSSVTESPRSNDGTVIASSEAPPVQSQYNGQLESEQQEKWSTRRTGSLHTMKSIDSMHTSTSRVSSWTDSTLPNTLTKRHGTADQGQLSAIQEHGGPEQAGQSGRASPATSHHDGYSVFRQPFVSGRSESRTKEIMDSNRVYSALMRRIDESSAENGEVGDATPKPTRTRKYDTSSPTTIRTVRQVPSSASVHSTLLSSARASPGARGHISVKKRDYHRDSFRLTPQQVAEYNESRHWQQSPSRSQTGFTSGETIPPSTPTPYGYATSSSHRRAISTSDDSHTIIVRNNTPIPVPQSPSVYSRTTSGPYDDESNYSDSEEDRGTVTILASHRLPYSPRKQSSEDPDRATKYSGEWREWMNSQMDIIDVNPVDTDFCRTHVREEAQIGDDGFRAERYIGGLVQETGPAEQQTAEFGPQNNEHIRQPLVELTSSSQGNFSRPLRRVPSGSISLGNASVRRPSVVPPEARPPSSSASIAGLDAQLHSRSASRTSVIAPLRYHKPRRSESPLVPTTPTRDALRSLNSGTPRNRYEQNPPGRRQSQVAPLTVLRTRQENYGFSKENQRLDDDSSPVRRRDMENNLSKLEGLHSTISTKRMVDMFLDDRRRMMGSSDDDGLSDEPAFI